MKKYIRKTNLHWPLPPVLTETKPTIFVVGPQYSAHQRTSLVQINEEFNRVRMHIDALAYKLTKAARKGRADQVIIYNALLDKARNRANSLADQGKAMLEHILIANDGKAHAANADAPVIARNPLKGLTRAQRLAPKRTKRSV